MCVMSMVMDHFGPKFPDWSQPRPTFTPLPYIPTKTIPDAPEPIDLSGILGLSKNIEELRALIKEFREAVAAAKLIDRVTHQPDCEDPDKAKLLERVERLEKLLAERDAASGY